MWYLIVSVPDHCLSFYTVIHFTNCHNVRALSRLYLINFFHPKRELNSFGQRPELGYHLTHLNIKSIMKYAIASYKIYLIYLSLFGIRMCSI